MRRFLALLAAVTLAATLFASPVVARHVASAGNRGASCVVTPASAPAGSTFTAVCTGFPKDQPLTLDEFGQPDCDTFPPDTGASITWVVSTSTVTLWSAHTCSATDSRGGFTVTQVVPISGPYAAFDAQVRIPPADTTLIDSYVQFTVTP